MFRLWCKLFDDSNHLLKDMVVENDDAATNRTRKIFDGIHSACYAFDLSEPIWLNSNVAEFKRHSKVRFYQDNFIDSIDFSYMEIQVMKKTNTKDYLAIIFFNKYSSNTHLFL